MSDSTGKPKPTDLASDQRAPETAMPSGAVVGSESPAPDHDDVALIHGRTEDGKGLRILRKRQDRIEVGAVMPLVPGRPIVGEVVRLEPREECPLLCDVHVEYSPPREPRGTSAGPAQVASDSYRENWEQIFGKREPTPALN